MTFNFKHCFEYFDNFNICNLIKKINPFYKLFYSTKYKCFYIVNTAKNCEICLIFYNLKQNILKMLNFTKVENSKNVFNDIENHNSYLLEKRKNEQLDFVNNQIKTLNYYSNRTHSANVHDMKKYIGEDLC